MGSCRQEFQHTHTYLHTYINIHIHIHRRVLLPKSFTHWTFNRRELTDTQAVLSWFDQHTRRGQALTFTAIHSFVIYLFSHWSKTAVRQTRRNVRLSNCSSAKHQHTRATLRGKPSHLPCSAAVGVDWSNISRRMAAKCNRMFARRGID